MKRKYYRRFLPVFLAVVTLILVPLVSCTSSQSSGFYNAGAADFTATGTQMGQYWLFRFDTSASGRTFTTSSAADLVSALQSPFIGEVIIFAVAADGANNVTLLEGPGVTIKQSATNVAANTTLTVYCELDNVSSGSAAATIY